MTNRMEMFPLMVHVPADEWAYARRRAKYLEAVLVQVLQDRERIREWYGAGEMLAFGLPGLPKTKAGITRLAGAGGWLRREAACQGGVRFEYHYSSLPARAFDALIARILNVPVPAPEADTPPVPEIEPTAAREREPDNTAPPWVLPFMRLLKGGANGDITTAWLELPRHLPAGVQLPTREEAAETIAHLGLIREA